LDISYSLAQETQSKFTMTATLIFYALAAGVILLLLIAAGGFFWLTSQSPLNVMREGAGGDPNCLDLCAETGTSNGVTACESRPLEAFRQLVARPGNRRRSRAELKQVRQPTGQ
jgi:predicted NUDIX family NTP pyrophosphohydrolase